MKKLGKFLLVGAVAAIAVAGTVGLAACGDPVYNGDYEGEYKYENAWVSGSYYGVKVTVTVEDNIIKSVVCAADTDTMHNVTPSWANHDATVAALPAYLKTFEGKTVDEVKAIKVAKEENGEPTTLAKDATTQGDYVLTGSTQTSGRIILAIQDALK